MQPIGSNSSVSQWHWKHCRKQALRLTATPNKKIIFVKAATINQ